MGIAWEKWVGVINLALGRLDFGVEVMTAGDARWARYSMRMIQQMEKDARDDAELTERLTKSRDYLAEECRRLRQELHVAKNNWFEMGVKFRNLRSQAAKVEQDNRFLKAQSNDRSQVIGELLKRLREAKRQLKNARRRERRWRLKCGA